MEEIMFKKLALLGAEEKRDLLNQIENAARSYEEEYGGCAKSTLAAIQRFLGLCDGEAFKAVFQATDALTGGVAYHQEMCGAVIAGVMAISLVYGPEKMEVLLPQSGHKPSQASQRHKEAVERGYCFVETFKRDFGGVTCKDVQKRVTGKYWDMRDPKDLAAFITKPYHDKCGLVTGKAARLAAEAILE